MLGSRGEGRVGLVERESGENAGVVVVRGLHARQGGHLRGRGARRRLAKPVVRI